MLGGWGGEVMLVEFGGCGGRTCWSFVGAAVTFLTASVLAANTA